MINFHGQTPRLLVIGDLIIDHYLWGSCNRISPEAPVQVINIDDESSALGGAGNVVNNLKALGAKVDLISVLGDCEGSKELKTLLNQISIENKFLIIEKGRLISKKTRIISSQQQVVRFDRESTNSIKVATQNQILKFYKDNISNYDAILISDYGKGLLTFKLTQSIIDFAKKHNKKVLIDPKGRDYSKYKGAYLLTPNKTEASEATGIDIVDQSTLDSNIKKLKHDCDLTISLITLSEQGVAIYENELKTYPTEAREVFDVTGAGDTMLASLGYAISIGINIEEAVKFANLASGVVVGKIGNSTASIDEIIEYESSLKKSTSDKHIKTINEISSLCRDLRFKGKKIIFTNGCFDIIHSGHIQYLEKAKEYGDILVLGLNSDNSISEIKGENRPINNQTDRAYIIAALESVDYVVIFDENTPYELIKAVKPHILVKGADYKNKEVIGHDLVKEVKLVDFVEGKSSTKTIEKIKKIK